MPKQSVPYREEDGTALIEIKLSSLQQLFSSLDPAPFREKDLERDAEAYIVDSVQELSGKERLKLVFYVQGELASAEETESLPTSVHNYFEYRRWASDRELRLLFRRGRLALAIGISFLFICLMLSRLVLALGSGLLNEVISEGLFICSWVAMWRPIEIFLFDWWPIRRQSRLYAFLTQIPVEVRPVGPLASPATEAS